MIPVGNTIVSDDLYLVNFVCSIHQCKGACCIEGDAGAPLTEEEIALLEDHIGSIKPFMTERGLQEIDETGVFDYDARGDYVTPLVKGLECAFANFNDGLVYCAIERAYEKGMVSFHKPVSCHLYPVRVTRLSDYDAVNYHQWGICKKAIKKGNTLGVPLYKFCKDALIRYYGEKWYAELEAAIAGKIVD